MDTVGKLIWYVDDKDKWNDVILRYLWEDELFPLLDPTNPTIGPVDGIWTSLRDAASDETKRKRLQQEILQWSRQNSLMLLKTPDSDQQGLSDFIEIPSENDPEGKSLLSAVKACKLLITDINLRGEPEPTIETLDVFKCAKSCLRANSELRVLFITSHWESGGILAKLRSLRPTPDDGSFATKGLAERLAFLCGTPEKKDQVALILRTTEGTKPEKAAKNIKRIEGMTSLDTPDRTHLRAFLRSIGTELIHRFVSENLGWIPVSSAPTSEDLPESGASSFLAVRPRFGLEHVVLPSKTKADILKLLDYVRYRRMIYEQWEFGRFDPDGGSTVFNFHGKPGTGKTLCAEAIAYELQRKIIKVNYAELEHYLVGQTSERIRQVFSLSQKENAVLFFDEADCALGKRVNVESAVDEAVNNARAAMMILMQSFKGVLILSTNLPKNFDYAFPSRITMDIEFLVPDESCCLELWQRAISPKVPGRANLDWNAIAKKSIGLTGRDIKKAALNAQVGFASLYANNLQQQMETRFVFDAIEAIMASSKVFEYCAENQGKGST